MSSEVEMQEVQEEVPATDTSQMDDAELEKALLDTVEPEPAQQSDAEEKPQEPVIPPEAKEDKQPEPTEEEKLTKQKADKEAFLLRQKTEIENLETQIKANATNIGEMRKAALQLRQEASEEVDTLTAFDKANAARDMEQRALAVEAQIRVDANRQMVAMLVPEFESFMPEVEEIIGEHLSTLGKNDAEKAAFIAAFKQSPYETSSATLTVLATAAKARREIAQLKGELAKVKTENATLAKKPDEILRQAARAAESPSVLSGKATSSVTDAGNIGDLSSEAIMELSDERLEALLKESDRGG